VIILDSHLRRSIDKILLDERLRKDVHFWFEVGLMISFYLKIHISIGKYLIDGWSILFIIIEHRLYKICDFFRKYHFKRRMALLITRIIIFTFYVFEDLLLMLATEWQYSIDHSIKDNSQCIDITGL
jgi:uncharacterized membrane protein YoaT (DUF817 family)